MSLPGDELLQHVLRVKHPFSRTLEVDPFWFGRAVVRLQTIRCSTAALQPTRDGQEDVDSSRFVLLVSLLVQAQKQTIPLLLPVPRNLVALALAP